VKNRFTRRRSEQIRHKINNESQDSIRQASRRVVEPPANQPLHNGFTPLTDNTSEEITGAIKRRFKVGWRVLSLLLVGILTYSLLVAWQSPDYKISAVKVTGLQRLTETEILSKVNTLGMHSFAVIPEAIRMEIIAAFPELRDVVITVGIPASLEIHVVERQPMVAWQSKTMLIWVDSEGYLIPPRGAVGEILKIQADSLPAYQLKSSIDVVDTVKIIRDKPFFKANPSALAFFAVPKQIDGMLLTAALQLNAWMPNEKTLLYQKQRGLGWKDARGWDVFVGQKLEGINDKMVMYETIVRELEKQGISPTLVSVEFLHAPYYRTD
jgi:cell division protein FtsQ